MSRQRKFRLNEATLWEILMHFNFCEERRHAIDTICRGRVRINGEIVQTPGYTFEYHPGVHRIEVGEKGVDFLVCQQ